MVWALVALSVLFAGPAWTGLAQQPQPGPGALQLQREIEFLFLINSLELTRDQMVALSNMLKEIQTARDALVQAETALRDFLMGFKGSREELKTASQPYVQKVEQATKALDAKLKQTTDRLKDVLTVRQWDILWGFIVEHDPVLRGAHEAVERLRQGFLKPEELERLKGHVQQLKELIGQLHKQIEELEAKAKKQGLEPAEKEKLEGLRHKLAEVEREFKELGERLARHEELGRELKRMEERLTHEREQALARFLLTNLELLTRLLSAKLSVA